MPIFVSTHTIRRGMSALPAAKAGRIASSSGRAIATPAPRRNVRRDSGRGAGELGSGMLSSGFGKARVSGLGRPNTTFAFSEGEVNNYGDREGRSASDGSTLRHQ